MPRDATAPASKSLAALNVAGGQLRYGLENLAGGSGSLGASLIRLGPAGLGAAAAIGALAVGLADNFGKALFPEISYFTLYAPMVLILAIKPTGLFGRE